MKACCALLTIAFLAPAVHADGKKESRPVQVPYRLTGSCHILVRARINGKGPFHFVVDTGAPALFVSTDVCKKFGIQPDKDGWGTFTSFELEGGVQVGKIQGKVADPFQLKGINQLGLAGTELHGVLGANLLGRFRIEIDFSSDKMTWTRLAHEPVLPKELGVAKMNEMEKMLPALGSKKAAKLVARGFLGIELEEKEGGVAVSAVLKGSPAASADLKPGDQIAQCQGAKVTKLADLQKVTARLTPGDELRLTITRGEKTHEVKVTLGKGF